MDDIDDLDIGGDELSNININVVAKSPFFLNQQAKPTQLPSQPKESPFLTRKRSNNFEEKVNQHPPRFNHYNPHDQGDVLTQIPRPRVPRSPPAVSSSTRAPTRNKQASLDSYLQRNAQPNPYKRSKKNLLTPTPPSQFSQVSQQESHDYNYNNQYNRPSPPNNHAPHGHDSSASSSSSSSASSYSSMTSSSSNDHFRASQSSEFSPSPLPYAQRDRPKSHLKRKTIPGPANKILQQMLDTQGNGDGSGADPRAFIPKRPQPNWNSIYEGTMTSKKKQKLDDDDETPALDDPDWLRGSWNALLDTLDDGNARDPTIPAYELYSQKNFPYNIKYILQGGWREKVQSLGCMIKSIRHCEGDAFVKVKDPFGIIGGTVHHEVLEEYGSEIAVGSVLLLKRVSVFSPTPASHYLNITIKNVVHVFPHDLPTASHLGDLSVSITRPPAAAVATVGRSGSNQARALSRTTHVSMHGGAGDSQGGSHVSQTQSTQNTQNVLSSLNGRSGSSVSLSRDHHVSSSQSQPFSQPQQPKHHQTKRSHSPLPLSQSFLPSSQAPQSSQSSSQHGHAQAQDQSQSQGQDQDRRMGDSHSQVGMPPRRSPFLGGGGSGSKQQMSSSSSSRSPSLSPSSFSNSNRSQHSRQSKQQRSNDSSAPPKASQNSNDRYKRNNSNSKNYLYPPSSTPLTAIQNSPHNPSNSSNPIRRSSGSGSSSPSPSFSPLSNHKAHGEQTKYSSSQMATWPRGLSSLSSSSSSSSSSFLPNQSEQNRRFNKENYPNTSDRLTDSGSLQFKPKPSPFSMFSRSGTTRTAVTTGTTGADSSSPRPHAHASSASSTGNTINTTASSKTTPGSAHSLSLSKASTSESRGGNGLDVSKKLSQSELNNSAKQTIGGLFSGRPIDPKDFNIDSLDDQFNDRNQALSQLQLSAQTPEKASHVSASLAPGAVKCFPNASKSNSRPTLNIVSASPSATSSSSSNSMSNLWDDDDVGLLDI